MAKGIIVAALITGGGRLFVMHDHPTILSVMVMLARRNGCLGMRQGMRHVGSSRCNGR
jgi:hypothetical protein